ncbi:MAG: hypothetical protein IJS74_01545 [Clostridia bacterium]|nr:hypothetical protein [Clostridia bacterium]
MENNSKDEITIKITRRDKIYLSIIAALLVAIVVLAIVLPRPYKTVEVEKSVEKLVYKDKYHTEKVYIIGKDNPIYHDGETEFDVDGKTYTVLEKYSFLDTGAFVKAVFIANITSDDVQSTYEINLSEALTDEFIKDVGDSWFGIDVLITSENMKAVTDILKESITGLEYSQTYRLNVEFEDAVASFIIDYIE